MPDVGQAEFQMGRQHRVIQACEKWWPHHRLDCNAFVRAVALELGITLNGDANHIHDTIGHAPWSSIGIGNAAASLAAVAATNGAFVVGAWKNPSGHGHVAVIVDTNYSSHTAPHRNHAIAYWGQLPPTQPAATGSGPREHASHTLSWGSSTQPHVLYASHAIPG